MRHPESLLGGLGLTASRVQTFVFAASHVPEEQDAMTMIHISSENCNRSASLLRESQGPLSEHNLSSWTDLVRFVCSVEPTSGDSDWGQGLWLGFCDSCLSRAAYVMHHSPLEGQQECVLGSFRLPCAIGI